MLDGEAQRGRLHVQRLRLSGSVRFTGFALGLEACHVGRLGKWQQLAGLGCVKEESRRDMQGHSVRTRKRDRTYDVCLNLGLNRAATGKDNEPARRSVRFEHRFKDGRYPRLVA